MAELEARYDVGRGAGTLLWRLELPPELLERLIVLPNDPEDSPCR